MSEEHAAYRVERISRRQERNQKGLMLAGVATILMGMWAIGKSEMLGGALMTIGVIFLGVWALLRR